MIGDVISKLRKARNGDLLVVINGSSDSANRIKNEISKSLGSKVMIRKLEDLTVVKIFDLDCETSKEEVLDAVSGVNDVGAKLTSLRLAYGESRTAVVILPFTIVRRLCAIGRLRVGLVYTRVRSIVLPQRCFKCLAFGHGLQVCDGTDPGVSAVGAAGVLTTFG